MRSPVRLLPCGAATLVTLHQTARGGHGQGPLYKQLIISR